MISNAPWWFPARHANSGAPMGRTLRERVTSSLVGEIGGKVRMPYVRSLGLLFGENDRAVDIMDTLLRSIGLEDVQALRTRLHIPAEPLLAMPLKGDASRKALADLSPMEALEEALWLGLCTPYLFDPSRPVVWTEVSLRRSLQLCEPRGFYV